MFFPHLRYLALFLQPGAALLYSLDVCSPSSIFNPCTFKTMNLTFSYIRSFRFIPLFFIIRIISDYRVPSEFSYHPSSLKLCYLSSLFLWDLTHTSPQVLTVFNLAVLKSSLRVSRLSWISQDYFLQDACLPLPLLTGTRSVSMQD